MVILIPVTRNVCMTGAGRVMPALANYSDFTAVQFLTSFLIC